MESSDGGSIHGWNVQSLSTPFSASLRYSCKKCGYVFPVLYGLLPNKMQQAYSSLFVLIKQIWPLFNPRSISLDFDMAVLNSARQEFPNADLRGCLFHLMKNFRKHLAESGLLQRYNTDATFSLQARMIIGIAFVPIAGATDAFESLCDTLPHELQPIQTWFEDNYIERIYGRNRRRRPAVFPIELWNVYDRVLNDQDRTNNHSEAAHRRLQTELDVNHPSIWRFIDGLRKVQKGRDLVYEQYVAGNPAPEKRRKYQQADDRIFNIVSSYNERDVIEYVRGVAHNFLME
jgi:MULE transposase domain